MQLAWIADGRLKLRSEGGAIEERVSAFAEQVAERHRSIQRRHAWKAQGRGARFAAWGVPLHDDLPNQVETARIVGASRGRSPGEVLYLLQTRSVSALLARPADAPTEELRLYHTADHQLVGVSMAPDQDRIAVCVSYPSGVTHLATLSRDGSRLTDVTEGDAIDAAARWCGPGRLVYQSAGIGRDAQGLYRGRAPFGIFRLDLARGSVDPLAADPAFDLLSPATDGSGALYYVRRPYVPPEPEVSLGRLLLAVLLFPLRLVQALLSWLDFFVVRYTGRPALPTAPGRPDPRQLFLLGNVVDAEQARRESLKAGDAVPALVPQSWELVRERGGSREVLARGVLAFDVAADGTVAYTNGRGVYVIPPGGAREFVAEDELVEGVVVL